MSDCIIKSLLDQDLYKFSMAQAVCVKYPNAEVESRFVNRGGTVFHGDFLKHLVNAIMNLSEVSLADDEYKYLLGIPFISPVFAKFMRGYRFDPNEVIIDGKGYGQFDIVIRGPWHSQIMWEVPLMAMISEIHFRLSGEKTHDMSLVYDNAARKAEFFKSNGMMFADFGSRRRYSHSVHETVVSAMSSIPGTTMVGTSNVDLARRYGLKSIGTHAHEWFQFHAAKFGFMMANRMALDAWSDVYRGSLGIALTDTFTTDDFFRVFDSRLARLYDGLRHDSGDPYVFHGKAVNHYDKLGIDPKSKTIIFSDRLNPQYAREIHDKTADKTKVSFGIGTNLTNDVGVKPLNMVIKMFAAKPEGYDRWIPTIKLSDSVGKHTGDPNMIDLCKRTLLV